MRRKDREITDSMGIEAILKDADTCHLALLDGDKPYVVALNYGWERRSDGGYALYFHCAREGRKLELIDRNANAAFFIDTGHELETGERPCDWSMKFRSLAGEGTIRRARDEGERRKALSLMMEHYAGEAAFAAMGDFDTRVLAATEALILEASGITGKERK